ncbi:MAG: hypothetical protein RIR16_416 [Actinomycetota bacterium]|jgi:beta-glucosidase
MSIDKAGISALVAKLSLEEKVELLTGRDFWNVNSNQTVGLRNMLLSDGPAGVRGEFWDERDNSLNLPSGSALGSTWSTKLAAEYGQVLAEEAKRKGVDVVLGPTINLHRSPYGGRHFECLSEDAMLSGALAGAYTKGMQALGVGACPKHYIANDFETDRYTANVIVDERTLRELYMRPFEDAVVDGGAWTIMSSYNSINGSTATEHELLQHPLRTDWNFDGVVISDWTAVRTLESAKYEQDLVMPGPVGPWGQALVDAVRNGEIEESTIDRKIERLLLLAARTGALSADGSMPEQPKRHNQISEKHVAFARKAAVQGSVLLENRDALPVSLTALKKVALIGHNASEARTQGGGSATVLPKSTVTPLAALSELLGDRLSYSMGAVVQEGVAPLDPNLLTNPVTNTRGVRVTMLGAGSEVLFSDDREATQITWLGAAVPLPTTEALTLETIYTPENSGEINFGYANVQPVKIFIDGELYVESWLKSKSEDPFTDLMDPPVFSKPLSLTAGKPVSIRFEVDMRGRTGLSEIAYAFAFGEVADRTIGDRLIAEAVSEAKSAELAIVVVGTNSQVESEGFDRKSLVLPGRQDELVEAVVAANPNTIVVVNAGSPVLLPWRNKVKAILVTYFGGQEMGNALVDMLTGAEEPGGRLPTTWAAAESDLPVSNCTPDANLNVPYTEGIHIGYRAWLKANTEPAYNFGHGLGYTSWSINSVSGAGDVQAGDDLNLSVSVTNTGSRKGKHIVQVYAETNHSEIDRPVRWLAGFAEVHADAGETKDVAVTVKSREFAHWDGAWKFEKTSFTLRVGSSSADLPVSVEVAVK